MQIVRYEVTGWAGVDHLLVLNPPDRVIEWFSEGNGEGKSSALEPLRVLAGGKATVSDGNSIVRQGRKRAASVVEWTDGEQGYKAEITATKSNALSVKLSNADGKPIKKPREALSRLFGTLYSPEEFRDWDLKRQLDLVRSVAGEEWAAEYDRLRATEVEAVETRREAGAKVRALGKLEPVEKVEPVDVAALSAELAAAEEYNRAQHDQIGKIERATEARDRAEESMNRALEALRAAEAVLAGEQSALQERERALDALALPGPPQDTRDIHHRLQQASETNAQAGAYDTYQRQLKAHTEAARTHARAETDVERAREAIATHQQRADLPDGLQLTEDGLTWRNRPLARASTGEGWQLTFRLAIGSGHRLLIHDRAESASPDVIRELEQLCREEGAVAFLATRGQPHTEGALELRDGRVVGAEDDLNF